MAYGNSTELSIEEILKRISEWDLWSYYIPNVELHKKILSPLRTEKRPSASLFVTKEGNILLKDFRLGTFNIWKFLEYKYNLNFYEVLLTINNDFNLKLTCKKLYRKPTMEFFGIIRNVQPKLDKHIVDLKIKKRDWNHIDTQYWGQYKMPISFLKKKRNHKVIPLQNYWVNDKLVYWYTDFNPAYSYEFGKNLENVALRKLYTPFSEYKWLTNTGHDLLQGEDDLPWIDDNLIITKSYKDVLLLTFLEMNSLAPQSESSIISEEKVNTLKKRFTNIYLLFDNDDTGRKYSKINCEKYNFIPIFVPNDNISKDISDFMKNNTLNETNKLIQSWMNLLTH